MMILSSIVPLFLAVNLFGAVPEKAVPLKREQIERQLVGPVLKWRLLGFPENRIGDRQYDKDGSFWWKRLDAEYSGTGSWRLDGDAFCEKYDPAQSWKGRDWVCQPVVMHDGVAFFGNTFVWQPEE